MQPTTDERFIARGLHFNAFVAFVVLTILTRPFGHAVVILFNTNLDTMFILLVHSGTGEIWSDSLQQEHHSHEHTSINAAKMFKSNHIYSLYIWWVFASAHSSAVLISTNWQWIYVIVIVALWRPVIGIRLIDFTRSVLCVWWYFARAVECHILWYTMVDYRRCGVSFSKTIFFLFFFFLYGSMQLVALQNYLFHTLNLKTKSLMTSSIIFQKRNKKSNSKTIYWISKGYK